MKGSFFGFGSPQQQVDMHARSKNTFIVFAFILTLFAQRLANNLLNDSFFQTPPLHDDWSDWSDFALCTALSRLFFTAPKAAPSGKEWICIFLQTTQKDQQVGGLMFHVDGNANRLWIEVKKLFQWFSRLFHLSENNFMHGALSDLKLCRMFLFT